jgi:Uma2 family endonuclease
MAVPTAKRRATYDDLMAVANHQVAEILDGELHVSPRPAPRHALASSRLGGDIIGPYDAGRGGPGGWWILDEPELHLADDVVVPDIAGWRRERLPAMPQEAFFAVAPDWVCETLSASTEHLDRGKKIRIYAREGVRNLWLINPTTATLESYRLEAGRWVLVVTHSGNEVVRLEPFDAVELELERLWGG